MRMIVMAQEAPVLVHNVEEEGRLLDGFCAGVSDRNSAEVYISELKSGGYRLAWSNQAHRLVVHRPRRHHPGREEMLNLMRYLGVDRQEKWEELRESLGF